MCKSILHTPKTNIFVNLCSSIFDSQETAVSICSIFVQPSKDRIIHPRKEEEEGDSISGRMAETVFGL